jgi:HEPN domain-containing protein
VYEDEIQNILKVTLTDEDNPNAGHLTLFRFKKGWIIHFDFRYNKQKSKDRFDAAKEFYKVAKFSYENELWRSFIDTSFSAAELLVTSQLFVLSDPHYPDTVKHRNIQSKYNLFIKIGNPKSEYLKTFNKLGVLRNDARYLKNSFKIDITMAKEFLGTIEDMINYTEKFIQ